MRTLLLTSLLALALAAPANADSIAYIKDGNVWLSTGDGSRQFQVTTTGGYADVSQADDGTMIALSGVRLHKLDRAGKVLADFDTPVSDTRPAPQKTFYGPFDPAISPDGTKVAYSYYYMTQSQNQSCYPPQCYTTVNEGGTGYSHSDRQTSWDEPGFYEHTGWRNPFWADNETTVLSDPTHVPNYDVVIDKPGERSGDTGFLAKNWFSDTVNDNPHVSGGDITRDKAKMAFVTGENDSTLTFYQVSKFPQDGDFTDGEADPSTYPTICYRYSGAAGGRFGTPTFSPDGAHAAFEEGDGIHVVDVPDFHAGCTTTGASPKTKLLIAGATQPDWGPADVPAPRATPTPTPTPTTTTGTPTTTPSGTPTAKVRLTAAKTTLRKALRQGLKVTVTGATGKVTIVARAGGKVVAKGTGAGALRLRFTPAAKRALARKHAVKLTLTAAGATASITLR